jgi:hypothetical protein
MAIQDEYDRVIDVRSYINSKAEMLRSLESVISLLNAAVAFKTKYPADAAEVDAGISFVKQKCQNIINAY